MVVPDTDATSFIKLLDLNMLAMTGGRERTKAEFRALLDAAVTSWRESAERPWSRAKSMQLTDKNERWHPRATGDRKFGNSLVIHNPLGNIIPRR
jgi:hypothetical protein